MGQSGYFDQFSFFQGYNTVREKWQYVVNDIALIFLPRPAQLNSGVQLVCLPHSPAEYRSVIVMGNILWPFYPFKMLFLWVGELDYLHHIIPFCEHCQTNATLLRGVLLISLSTKISIVRRTPHGAGSWYGGHDDICSGSLQHLIRISTDERLGLPTWLKTFSTNGQQWLDGDTRLALIPILKNFKATLLNMELPQEHCKSWM